MSEGWGYPCFDISLVFLVLNAVALAPRLFFFFCRGDTAHRSIIAVKSEEMVVCGFSEISRYVGADCDDSLPTSVLHIPLSQILEQHCNSSRVSFVLNSDVT